ncbi:MAG: aldo/keto reductase [Actinomycetes bacterium]
MLRRRVGRSGLELSRLGLGTLGFGRDTDVHEARELVIQYAEAGGNWLDTSDEYSGGESERILGQVLAQLPDAGRGLLVATKSGGCPGEPRRYNSSRTHLLSALDASLERLGRDHIDLWQLQVRDPLTPIDESLAAADYAISSGRVRYVGVSNYSGWQLAESVTWQRAIPARTDVVANQVEYSLVQRGIEREVAPAAANFGVGIIAWSPLGRGVLTGKYRRGTPADSRGSSSRMPAFIDRYLAEEPRRIVDAVCTAADGLGIAPLEVALSWVRDRPGVTSAIVGPRTTAQLAAVLQAEEIELPFEIRAVLDEISMPDSDYPEAGWSQPSAGSQEAI